MLHEVCSFLAGKTSTGLSHLKLISSLLQLLTLPIDLKVIAPPCLGHEGPALLELRLRLPGWL